MTILILICTLGGDPNAYNNFMPEPLGIEDVPKGVKDPEKWLLAKAKRDGVKAARLWMADQMKRSKHMQQHLDRQERIRNYPWHLHPMLRAQQQMAAVQSMAVANVYRRFRVPTYTNNGNITSAPLNLSYRPQQAYSGYQSNRQPTSSLEQVNIPQPDIPVPDE